MPAMVGVGNRASRCFCVVESIGRTADFVENCDRLDLRPLGPNQEVSAIIVQIERGNFAAVGYRRPSALMTDRGSSFAVTIGVSLDHRSRPMFLHDPLIKD